MKLNNKKIIIPIIAAIAIACACALFIKPSKNDTGLENNTAQTDNITEESGEATAEEENPTKNDENINGLDKPIFMYFVTNADLEDKTTKESIERLQKEYKDTVIFEIRNADEDPSLYDNFPIDGAMPMLIMQKKGGDISNFLFKENNYDNLKSAIDATL